MTRVQLVEAAPTVGRVLRNPQHRFQLRTRPWQIQPFMIAPVLPGETMKNMLIQSRVVSDPVANPLIGWWSEYYVFYVKHRDMEERALLQNMVLIPGTDLSSLTQAANPAHYHAGGSLNWVDMCLRRVVDEYFRDDGEAVTVATLDGMPLASISTNGWWDSLKDATVAVTAEKELPGYEDDPNIVAGYATHYAQWQQMRDMKLTSATYEDFLRSYGVKVPEPVKVDQNRPELIRYMRDWTYPSNTVDPLTGTPSSALSWSIAERADKDRFFTEPGFLFGVTVARPKVYLGKIKGVGASMMADAFSWLPAVASDDPYTSLRNFANTAGPLQGNVTNGYWADIRDLLIYGDQFLNFALTATDAGLVALPSATGLKRFASSADANALFKTATVNLIRQDGVCSLNILGRQTDQT